MASTKKKNDDPQHEAASVTGAASFGANLAGVGGVVLSDKFINNDAVDEKTLSDLADAMGVKNTTVHRGPNFLQAEMEAYDMFHDRVLLKDKSSIAAAAHEFGHAKSFNNTRPLSRRAKVIIDQVSRLGTTGLAIPQFVVAHHVAEKIRNNELDADSKAVYAPLAMSAISLPLLYEEAKASVLGYKGIKKVKGSRAALKSLASLGPAWLSYAGLGLGGGVAGTAYLKKYQKQLNEKNSMNKLAKSLVSNRLLTHYLPAAAGTGAAFAGIGAVNAQSRKSSMNRRADKAKKPQDKQHFKNVANSISVRDAALAAGVAGAGLGAFGAGQYLKGRKAWLGVKKEIGADFRKRSPSYKHENFWDYVKADAQRRAEGYQRQNYGGRTRDPFKDTEKSKEYFGVKNAKTKAEVKKAYRDAARQHHPDSGGSDAKMKEVNDHFDNIKNTSWFDKLAFMKGFEKVALPFTIMGGTVLPVAALAYVRAKNKEEARKLTRITEKEGENADALFKSIRNEIPKNTKLLTHGKIDRLLKAEKNKKRREFLTEARKQFAAALDKEKADSIKEHLPSDLKGNHVIVTQSKVAPSVLYHEAGHVRDFDRVSKMNAVMKLLHSLKPVYFRETAAWDQAPGEINPELKEMGLGSYRRSYLPAAAAVTGVTLGAILDYNMYKGMK